MGFFASIMKFIMIVLVAILTVFIVLGAILIIFPTVNIFGLHYISSDYNSFEGEVLRTSENSTLWDDADIVRIETKGYDVTVRTKDDELLGNGEFVTIVNSSYKGFVWGTVSQPTYSSSITSGEYIVENGKNIFYIEIAEPDGWIMRAETTLTVIVSSDAFTSKDLEIIDNSGSVTIGGNVADVSEQIRTQNLDITSTSGMVNLGNVTVSDTLTIDKQSGDVSSRVNLNANININITGGYGIITLKDVGVSGGDVKMLSINSSNTHTTVQDVYGDFNFVAAGGLLEIGNITGFVDLDVSSCDCSLGTVGNGFNVEGGDGYLEVEKVVGAVTIIMNDGSTTIAETDSTVNWESQKGSLTLGKAQDDITAQTVYGNINIICDDVDAFNITINDKHGDTTFTGVKGIVDINTSTTIDNMGTGNITGTFAEVNGESRIIAYVGNINVTVPQTDWLLKWASSSADIQIGALISSETSSNGNWINVLTNISTNIPDNENRIYLSGNSGLITVNATAVA